jgi:formyl-CoA transferase
LDHVLTDPRLDDATHRHQVRDEVLHPLLVDLLATKPSTHWLDLLYEADVPAGPVLSRREVFDEPQVLENEMLTTVQQTEKGRATMVGVPFSLSETPGTIRRPAPQVGEHTEEILATLGYSAEEMDRLRAQGIV